MSRDLGVGDYVKVTDPKDPTFIRYLIIDNIDLTTGTINVHDELEISSRSQILYVNGKWSLGDPGFLARGELLIEYMSKEDALKQQELQRESEGNYIYLVETVGIGDLNTQYQSTRGFHSLDSAIEYILSFPQTMASSPYEWDDLKRDNPVLFKYWETEWETQIHINADAVAEGEGDIPGLETPEVRFQSDAYLSELEDLLRRDRSSRVLSTAPGEITIRSVPMVMSLTKAARKR